MPTTTALRRMPQVQTLNESFEEVFTQISDALAAGEIDSDTAARLLVTAIHPWMQSFAAYRYHQKTGGGARSGGNADTTVSEVNVAVWRAAQNLRWDQGVVMARKYLTHVAAMAVSQAGRSDDDMERRHRSYLKHSKIVADQWALDKGRPLTATERREAILWALANEVPVWLRPSPSNFDEFADMVERYWLGTRYSPDAADPDDGDRHDPNEKWDRHRDTADDDGTVDTTVQNSETQFLHRVMRAWTEVMTPKHRDMVLGWLDEQNTWGAKTRSTPPAQMLNQLERYIPQLIGLIAQEDADAASAAVQALTDKAVDRSRARAAARVAS